MFRHTLILIALAAAPLWAAPRQTVLAIWSHPDDETSIGCLLAKLAREGNDVWQVAITSGQKGFTPNTKITDGAELGRVRETELRCSAGQLGVHEPILLGYQDQGISTPPVMREILDRLREIIDQKKPDVIITWGPEGLTGHPDHRTTSSLATEIFQQRARLKHQPKKLYYVAFPDSLAETLLKAFNAPLRTTADEFITTRIDCGEEDLAAAYRSIQCHKTQWSAQLMKSRDQLQRETLAGRVYLRLALGAGKQERSLFE